MNEPKQINSGIALQWLEGDEIMFTKIKAIFIKNIPSQVALLKEFLDAEDNSSAERAAHTIMGSSAMLGASAMSEKAKKIEQSSIDGDIRSARCHFDGFLTEYQKVMAELVADGGNK